MPRSKLRWGFGTEANAWARDLRDEMNVARDAPLCPLELAEHLYVPVYLGSQLPLDQRTRQFLLGAVGRREVSAGVFYVGTTAVIVANDAFGPKRLASDIAHEIAHILLRHKPIGFSHKTGRHVYDQEAEDEAARLGPTLLVSEEAALLACELIHGNETTLAELSDEWSVSTHVIQMRINLTGARQRRAN